MLSIIIITIVVIICIAIIFFIIFRNKQPSLSGGEIISKIIEIPEHAEQRINQTIQNLQQSDLQTIADLRNKLSNINLTMFDKYSSASLANHIRNQKLYTFEVYNPDAYQHIYNTETIHMSPVDSIPYDMVDAMVASVLLSGSSGELKTDLDDEVKDISIDGRRTNSYSIVTIGEPSEPEHGYAFIHVYHGTSARRGSYPFPLLTTGIDMNRLNVRDPGFSGPGLYFSDPCTAFTYSREYTYCVRLKFKRYSPVFPMLISSKFAEVLTEHYNSFLTYCPSIETIAIYGEIERALFYKYQNEPIPSIYVHENLIEIKDVVSQFIVNCANILHAYGIKSTAGDEDCDYGDEYFDWHEIIKNIQGFDAETDNTKTFTRLNDRTVILSGPVYKNSSLGERIDCDYDLTIGYRYAPEYGGSIIVNGQLDDDMTNVAEEYDYAVCTAYEFILRKFENMEIKDIITYSNLVDDNLHIEDMSEQYDEIMEKYASRTIWLHGGNQSRVTKQMINEYNPAYSKMNAKPVDGIDKQTNDGMLDIGPQNSFTIPLTYKNGRLVKDVPRKPLNPECVVPYEVYADAWNDTDTSDAHFRDVTIDVNKKLDEAIVTKNVKPVQHPPLMLNPNVNDRIKDSRGRPVMFRSNGVRRVNKVKEAEYWEQRWY